MPLTNRPLITKGKGDLEIDGKVGHDTGLRRRETRVFSLRLLFPIVPIAILICGAKHSRADSFTCPVTEPDPSFVPPAPFAANNTWFGTEKLWTILDDRWVPRGHFDIGYEVRKIVWFSADYDAKLDGSPSLVITGRRLDGPSGPLSFDVSGGYIENQGQPRKSFMPSNLYFPELGCWEITAHYKGADLTFVVQVGH